MPLSLVRLSSVNVLRDREQGGWRGREKPESGRGKAAAAKFKTVPMTPGDCCAGVSPVGTEQVNTELRLVLVVLYLPVQFVGPSVVLWADADLGERLH